MKEYEKASPKEVIASAFGLDTDTTTELLALQHNFNQAMLENERQALEEKLKEEDLTADDRIALNRQLNDTLNDIEDDRNTIPDRTGTLSAKKSVKRHKKTQ